MNNVFIFVILVLMSGSGWLPIKLQAQIASADVSIFYRHLIVSAILLSWCFLAKRNLRFSLKNHFFFMILGLTMFSFHYLFIYGASQYLVTGVLAVLYSSVGFFNVFNNRLFFKTKPTRNELLGIGIGISGLCLFFSQSLSTFSIQDDTIKGIVLIVMAACIFSVGNAVSKRNSQKGINPLVSITMAAVYGTVAMALFMFLNGASFIPPKTSLFWSLTLYLALSGTIIGFWCLMKLIENVGPNKAGYAIICVPIVALTISSFVEDYTWTRSNFMGVVLILLGSVFLVNRKWRSSVTKMEGA